MTYSSTNAVILSRIEMFKLLASELHFGRTAKQLGISQSALSEQIRKLEADLDIVLFERDTRNVSLTEAGRQLVEPAHALLEQADRFRHRAEVAREREGSVLRLAYVPSSSITVMTSLMGPLMEIPDLSIETHMMPAAEMETAIRDGSIDAGLIFEVNERLNPDLGWIDVAVDQAIVHFGPHHPLASKESITVDELVASPLAIGPDLTGRRTTELEDRFASLGYTINVAHASKTMNDHLLHLLTSSNIGLATEFMAKIISSGGLLSRPIDAPFPVRWGFEHAMTLHPRLEQILRDVGMQFRSELPPPG